MTTQKTEKNKSKTQAKQSHRQAVQWKTINTKQPSGKKRKASKGQAHQLNSEPLILHKHPAKISGVKRRLP